MWLKDLLPEAIPNIRIMTFGYNARFKNFTAQQDLRSISCKLLAELVDLRTTHEVNRFYLFSFLPLIHIYRRKPAQLFSFVTA